jgi:hypothetical protein
MSVSALAWVRAEGIRRRKAPRVRESLGIGVPGVDLTLVRLGELGAVRASGGVRQEVSAITRSRQRRSPTSSALSRLGKPGTPRGRASMVAALDAPPSASWPGMGDAACGWPMALWIGAYRPLYEGAEVRVRIEKERSTW